MAGWTLDPVDESPGAITTPLDKIPDDVKDAVEATLKYCEKNPNKRLVTPPFATEDSRKQAAIDIRSYCEQRKAGRLSASIQRPDKHPVTKKAGLYLSLKVTPYVKRERQTASTDQNSDT